MSSILGQPAPSEQNHPGPNRTTVPTTALPQPPPPQAPPSPTSFYRPFNPTVTNPTLTLYTRRLSSQTEALSSLFQTSINELKAKEEELAKLLTASNERVKTLEARVVEVGKRMGQDLEQTVIQLRNMLATTSSVLVALDAKALQIESGSDGLAKRVGRMEEELAAGMRRIEKLLGNFRNESLATDREFSRHCQNCYKTQQITEGGQNLRANSLKRSNTERTIPETMPSTLPVAHKGATAQVTSDKRRQETPVSVMVRKRKRPRLLSDSEAELEEWRESRAAVGNRDSGLIDLDAIEVDATASSDFEGLTEQRKDGEEEERRQVDEVKWKDNEEGLKMPRKTQWKGKRIDDDNGGAPRCRGVKRRILLSTQEIEEMENEEY